MIDEEMLNFMKPKISVEYRIQPGFLSHGELEVVPENAYGALIYQNFPIVGTNGEFEICGQSYNLYVGKILDINEYLKDDQNNELKSRLIELKVNGYSKVVIPDAFSAVNTKPSLIIPITGRDAVYSSNQEMADAIEKINLAYNSIDISIQKSLKKVKHSKK